MATLVSPAPPAEDRIWRLSVDQYHTMIESGILPDDSPVELIEGILLEKMSKNPPHVFVTEEFRAALASLLPVGWCVRAQDPITLGDSEPEPDIVVARGTSRDYAGRNPGPHEIAVIVEVPGSTLARDRGIKQRVYARARIPVYVIVDVNSRRVEVRTDPANEAYRTLVVLSTNDVIPVTLDGAHIGTIPVATLFP